MVCCASGGASVCCLVHVVELACVMSRTNAGASI